MKEEKENEQQRWKNADHISGEPSRNVYFIYVSLCIWDASTAAHEGQ